MTRQEALEQLCQLLDSLYDDRDELAKLARESKLSLSDIVSGETVSDFLRNIVIAAHRQSKVEDLIKTAAFEWSEQAVAIKKIYEIYRGAEDTKDAPAFTSFLFANMGDANSSSANEPSGGDDIDVGDVSGTGIAIGRGAKAIVNNLYNSVNNTINQLSPRAFWGGAIGIFLIAAILFWTFLGKQVTAYFTPLWLNRVFNVAVVEFGEIKPSGKISSSSAGSDMSQWLYDGLFGSYQQFNADIKDKVGIVHKLSPEVVGQSRKFAPLLFVDPVARCEAAKKLAGEINAQMLVYGTLDKRPELAQFELSFYISPDVQTWLALNNLQTGTSKDATDCLPLGETLPVPLPFSNSVIRDQIARDVTGQGTLFFWLTLALIKDQQGEWQSALKYFSTLEESLSGLSQHEAKRYGADLVSYFLGQQYILNLADRIDGNDIDVADLTLVDKAVENFQKAADLKGRYENRAEKGLGDVWLYMGTIAQKLFHQNGAIDEEVLVIPDTYTNAAEIVPQLLKHRQNMAQALAHAAAHYAKAAELTRQLDDPYLTLVIEFSVAETTWAEGQLLYISYKYDEAILKMNTAINSLNLGDESLFNRAKARGDDRLVTKAYQTLGLAYFQLSDMLRTQNRHEERLAHLKKAEDFFQKCVAKKDDALLDKLISNEMVADLCQPKLEEVRQARKDALTQIGEQK